MSPGFIPGSRASLAIDLLAMATVLAALLLAASIYSVRLRHNYQRHRRLQIFISVLLLFALIFFEAEVRVHGWQAQAAGSAFFATLPTLLVIHITIAVAAALAWITTLTLALLRFPIPPAPDTHSNTHRRLARLTVALTYLTASSGLLFYVLAFVL